MTAYLWSQLDQRLRANALASTLQHPLASVRMRAQRFRTGEAQDKDGVWIDHGEGGWTVQACIWPEDIAKGVRVGEAAK